MSALVNLFLIKLISIYQRYLSFLMGTRCRFTPTCSEYAKQALIIHGTLLGVKLALLRLLKCHPWHAGGFDPVPEKNT